ncbi:phosphoribosylanthranilate isomerase [Candidatus Bipolaricaulota bacterium]|nr:phosphoribosylanthranilate isomerase [Candidatus Bipolaricaulota bacterium]
MVRVKICGNRTVNDLNVVRGADAVGFIVATPESPRNIAVDRAVKLTEEVPPFVSTVAVTTEPRVKALEKLTRSVKPDYLQLHSNLSPGRIEEISGCLPDRTGMIALLSVASGDNRAIERAEGLAGSPAAAIIMDSEVAGRTGGTGEVHDWKTSRRVRDFLHPFPVFLAGGLRPENVKRAVREVRPYAIDVATGVEEGGVKSAEKVRSLINEVNSIEA